jgi:hypothetical protein
MVSDFPTPVGPNMTSTRSGSGFRPIQDLLRQDLLEGGRDYLALVLLQLIVTGEVYLDASLHGRAGELVYIALKTGQ